MNHPPHPTSSTTTNIPHRHTHCRLTVGRLDLRVVRSVIEHLDTVAWEKGDIEHERVGMGGNENETGKRAIIVFPLTSPIGTIRRLPFGPSNDLV